MAGYDNFSESNNSIDAKQNGRFPASILAKRIGVKTGAIKSLLTPCEWHHTSSRFNMTDFYDEEEAYEILDRLKAWENAEEVETTKNCTVIYKEWGGSRKHPICHNVTITADVEKKGEWFKIYPIDGAKSFRKKETNIVSIIENKEQDNGKESQRSHE